MEDFDEIAPDRAVVVMTVHQIGIVFPPAFDNVVFGHTGEGPVVVKFAESEERVGCGIKEDGIVVNAAVAVLADEFGLPVAVAEADIHRTALTGRGRDLIDLVG